MMALLEQCNLPIDISHRSTRRDAFPRAVTAKAPPIKSQGIKTKLVPKIASAVKWDSREGTWIEPFVGSGAVAFNIGAPRVIAADSNRHLIRFYQYVQRREITSAVVREFLQAEGADLLSKGETHYYDIRDRFNRGEHPLDFLFLSRSCFNGMIRFSKKGGYNVPFCRKPDRFRAALVTKIVNQVAWMETIIHNADWTFVVQDWRETLSTVDADDFVYLDPPYVGRHTDYYNSWDEKEADALAKTLTALPCGFAYSMWAKNKYRENDHLKKWFSDYPRITVEHFYHVGPTEELRNAMEEAIVIKPGFAA